MTKLVDRIFNSFSQSHKPLSKDVTKSWPKSNKDNKEKLLNYVRENVIGGDLYFRGPFGLRKVTYLDYIASGRALQFIEDYIQEQVLPKYGNTHTTTGVISLQTTLFRQEARNIIRNSVNASEHDSVIFVGSGTTGAIHKLIHGLSLDRPPVVFIGPYEHHSNILPWKEITSEVFRIKQQKDGLVDISDLEAHLKKWKDKQRQMIGSFSAASNVTGILVDVDDVTACLHRYGALAFWDYATAAPYVKIDMNPLVPGDHEKMVYKDAVFLSPHKFMGGVSTPGLLIAKNSVFRNIVPEGGGGGTVSFVRRDRHHYLQDQEEREEGGTPAIVESIRAGLVFQLKEAITTDTIMEREQYLLNKAKTYWKSCKNLVILGNLDVPRLPVFSFLVYHADTGRFLHYNFVSAVLNDVFGIQARGGCACAGPYTLDLLGLEEQEAENLEHLLMGDWDMKGSNSWKEQNCSHRDVLRCFRPGFTRLSLPYFIDDDCLQFVLEAVELVAQHAHTLLPQYMFIPETGDWRQRNAQVFKDRKWLGHISYKTGEMSLKVAPQTEKGPLPKDYQDCLRVARDIFKRSEKTKQVLPDQTLLFDNDSQPFRWFVLPSEAHACLHDNKTHPLPPRPLFFVPQSLKTKLLLEQNEQSSAVDGRIPKRTTTSLTSSLKLHVEESFVAVQQCLVSPGDVEDSSSIFTVCKQNMFAHDQCVCAKLFQHTTYVNIPEVRCRLNVSRAGSVNVSRAGSVNVSRAGSVNVSRAGSVNVSSKQSEKEISTSQSIIITALKSLRNKLQCNKRVDPTVDGETMAVYKKGVQHTPFHTCSNHSDPLRHPTPKALLPNPLQQGVIFNNMSNLEKNNHAYSDGTQDSDIHGLETKMDPRIPRTVRGGQTVDKHSVRADGGGLCFFMADAGGQHTTCTDKPNIYCEFDVSITTCIDSSATSEHCREKHSEWVSPPKPIFKAAVKAIEEYGMIQDGDRVLVCLSGGKDSLSLLHTLRQYQFYARGRGVCFEFGAVTVDPETPAYDPSPLKQYLHQLGVPYFYESQGILETAKNLPYECTSICSFCNRMKRSRMYATARREGYNVLALGQHLDDVAESFLLSFFHNGVIRTMAANYTLQEGDLRVVRPFVYVREKELRNFAQQNKLPVITENSPACFEPPKERRRMKQLLAIQELLFPNLYHSMMAAMKPVMTQRKLAMTSTPCRNNHVPSRVNTGRGRDRKDTSEDDEDEACTYLYNTRL